MSEYSIRINQIKVKADKSEENLAKEVSKEVVKKLNELSKVKDIKGLLPYVKDSGAITYKIVKKSVDSRYKPDIYYVYSVDVENVKDCNLELVKEKLSLGLKKNVRLPKDVTITSNVTYKFPVDINTDVGVCADNNADEPSNVHNKHIVIGGFGPAGMFVALKLVRAGFKPIVLERGESVEERTATVKSFWETGVLNTESNVQFGEGGAGTFSDGKLNTMIKDNTGRIKEVLNELVNFGADESILYVNKPHIGTDVLAKVVKNIRTFILDNGGEIRFNTKITDVVIEKGAVCAVRTVDTKTKEENSVPCDYLCLAIGHSARDTFEMLYKKGSVSMEPKAFAVGLRIEHPQELINYNAYGDIEYNMPAADYKVTCQTSEGRGVYSFCMCPGGFVVNASSEVGRLAVNGMSYSGRDSANANSALIVTVTPKDFGEDVLDGVRFQRELEQKAFDIAGGAVPVQLLKDYKTGCVSKEFGSVIPCIKGRYAFADLNKVMPEFINKALQEGVTHFAGMIKGFDMDDAVFAGVESRTSSPIRILRDAESLQASIKGFYPCGEGAGYAGGITSAAVDAIKVAEKIALAVVNDN